MALDLDDLLTPRKAAPAPLETLSVDELEAYIGRLSAEIERARAAIAGKQSQRAAADALFKS